MQEEEYVEGEAAIENEEQQEEDSAASTSTTTTESTKKIGISVRPFRSNEELLSALKKRRLSEKSQKSSSGELIDSTFSFNVSDNFQLVVDLNLAHSPLALLMKFIRRNQLHHQFHRFKSRLYSHHSVHNFDEIDALQWITVDSENRFRSSMM